MAVTIDAVVAEPHSKSDEIAEAYPATAMERVNRKDQYRGGITWRVMIAAFIAANAGLIYGYSIGVTGGATTFPSWQARFFPILLQDVAADDSPYCKYDNQLLALFTSSLFLAGSIAAMGGGYFTDKFGRRVVMICGGALVLLGLILQCSAMSLGQLTAGRVIMGLGVGINIQAANMFLAEIAPYQWRGAINNMFQTFTTLGIFTGQVVTWQLLQYDIGGTTDGADWNWRLAFGICGVPGLIICIGSIFSFDSPAGLVKRGHLEEAQRVLRSIRGTDDIEAEYLDTLAARDVSNKCSNPWKTIGTLPYLPQLVIAVFMPLGQTLPGIDSVMFYSPQIFQTLGKNAETALLWAVILSGSQWVCTLIAVATVDKLGRRPLMIQGGVQMVVALVALGAMIATAGTGSDALAAAVLALMIIYAIGFAWSWGPLGWLVPTEIQPLETRSVGMAITTSTSLAITFLNGQAFPSMYCTMEYGVFLWFAAWMALATVFTIFFIPEVKNVPLEEIEELFFQHKLWGKLLAKVAAAKRMTKVDNNMELGRSSDASMQGIEQPKLVKK